MRRIFFSMFLLYGLCAQAQILTPERSVDWTLAGLRGALTNGFLEIDMQAQGVIGDGSTSNDDLLDNVLTSIAGPGAILNFPSGNFLFESTIYLPSNIIIKGAGAALTTFTMDLDSTGHSFRIQGQSNSSNTTSIIDLALKDDDFITVSESNSFSTGDWIQIGQDDSDLVTSTWAENSVGQIVKIKSISNNRIELESPLRMDFELIRSPYIVSINPVENVGIECLKIHRLDSTAPVHSSNVFFNYAVNCWVKGIESENCTFSHAQASHSSNLYFSKSYFHHAFDYGGGGRAYGVVLQASSNECLVENNIFEHLRHSMLLQSGANGNVFAYNYSLDPFWDLDPSDAAGDMVLHGNFPYANLFEQNICRNIVIDDSHGPNGPYNTVFRNRAEGFGIFFSETNSPNQNLMGNEITNITDPYDQYNYTIQGIGHFIHGNNNKGTIHPVGTNVLMDPSLAYTDKPDFIPDAQWAGMGTPNIMGAKTIPAYDRYISGTIFDSGCSEISAGEPHRIITKEKVIIAPNPLQATMRIESSHFVQKLRVINAIGQVLQSYKHVGYSKDIETADWKKGIYFIVINFTNKKSITERVVKASSY